MRLKTGLMACAVIVMSLFCGQARADVIGPNGEPPPHHYLPVINGPQPFPIRLAVEKAPSGSGLFLVDKYGKVISKVKCTGKGPCGISVRQAGKLYLAPKGLPGDTFDVESLLREHNLNFLMTFEEYPAHFFKPETSCSMEKKDSLYILKCKH